MMLRFCFLFVSILVCKAEIAVPSPRDLPICRIDNLTCVVSNINRVIEAVSKPIAKYNISGYDSLPIFNVSIRLKPTKITVKLDAVITGLGNSKLVGIINCGEDDSHPYSMDLESNVKFSGNMTVSNLHSHNNSETYYFTGGIVGLNTKFDIPLTVIERNYSKYYEMGNATLSSHVNTQTIYFTVHGCGPDVLFIIDKIKQSRDLFPLFVKKIVEGPIHTLIDENRKFYKNVPMSEYIITS